MTPAPLETERLRLVPATLELADADLHNRLEFMHRLGALVLEDWPPPLNDEASMRWFVELLRANPGAAGWAMWYWVAKKHKPVVVGNGGFKGPPSGGAVEIGYSLLPRFQKKGYASEAVAALVAWAFAHEEVERVVAETLPDLAPSIRLLERAGFSNETPSGGAVLRYVLRRPASRRGGAPGP